MKNDGPSLLAARLHKTPCKYFTVTELLYKGAGHYSGRAKNTPLPRGMVGELFAVAHKADAIRKAVNHPLIVISGYRGPDYNRAIGGARNSYHKKAMALDLRPADPAKLSRLKDVALAAWHRGEIGGLGFYSSFVHIDTGPKRRWGR